MTDRPTNQPTKTGIQVLRKARVPTLLGNNDRPTDQLTKQTTNELTD